MRSILLSAGLLIIRVNRLLILYISEMWYDVKIRYSYTDKRYYVRHGDRATNDKHTPYVRVSNYILFTISIVLFSAHQWRSLSEESILSMSTMALSIYLSNLTLSQFKFLYKSLISSVDSHIFFINTRKKLRTLTFNRNKLQEHHIHNLS